MSNWLPATPLKRVGANQNIYRLSTVFDQKSIFCVHMILQNVYDTLVTYWVRIWFLSVESTSIYIYIQVKCDMYAMILKYHKQMFLTAAHMRSFSKIDIRQ